MHDDHQWVVLLEAARGESTEELGPPEVRRLLRALDPHGRGAALQCADRYALQVTTAGCSPVEALADVHSRWTDAVRQLDLPTWKVVRMEVLTPEELTSEWHDAQRGDAPVGISTSSLASSQSGHIGHTARE